MHCYIVKEILFQANTFFLQELVLPVISDLRIKLMEQQPSVLTNILLDRPGSHLDGALNKDRK